MFPNPQGYSSTGFPNLNSALNGQNPWPRVEYPPPGFNAPNNHGFQNQPNFGPGLNGSNRIYTDSVTMEDVFEHYNYTATEHNGQHYYSSSQSVNAGYMSTNGFDQNYMNMDSNSVLYANGIESESAITVQHIQILPPPIINTQIVINQPQYISTTHCSRHQNYRNTEWHNTVSHSETTPYNYNSQGPSMRSQQNTQNRFYPTNPGFQPMDYFNPAAKKVSSIAPASCVTENNTFVVPKRRYSDVVKTSSEKAPFDNSSQITYFIPHPVLPVQVAAESALVKAEPATVKAEPATVKAEPATVKAEPATVKSEPATVKAEPATVKAEPATVKAEPATVKAEPATVKAEPATVKAEPATVKAEPATVKAEPATVKVEPATVKAEPATDSSVELVDSKLCDDEFEEQVKKFPHLPKAAHQRMKSIAGCEITHYFRAQLVRYQSTGIFNSDKCHVLFTKQHETGEYYLVAFSNADMYDRTDMKFNRLLTNSIRVTVKGRTEVEIRPVKSAEKDPGEYFVFIFPLPTESIKFLDILYMAYSQSWIRDPVLEGRKKKYFSRDIFGRVRLPGYQPPPISTLSTSSSDEESRLPKKEYLDGSSEEDESEMLDRLTIQEKIWPKSSDLASEHEKAANEELVRINVGSDNEKETDKEEKVEETWEITSTEFEARGKLSVKTGRMEYAKLWKGGVMIAGHDNSYDQFIFLNTKEEVIAHHIIYQWHELKINKRTQGFCCEWSAPATLVEFPKEIPENATLIMEFKSKETLVEFCQAFEKSTAKALKVTNLVSEQTKFCAPTIYCPFSQYI